jgi:hypothetical protein
MTSFESAFRDLLRLAPGPIFPRARALYFHKYPLEGKGAAPFRTHLMEEEIEEPEALQGGGSLVRARSAYLSQQWQLNPADLKQESGLWFRDEGHYASFTAPALYRSKSAEDGQDPP